MTRRPVVFVAGMVVGLGIAWLVFVGWITRWFRR